MSSTSAPRAACVAFLLPAFVLFAPGCSGMLDESTLADSTSAETSPRSDGSACSSDSQCSSRRCSVDGYSEEACGTCLVALHVGEPCGAAGTTCSRTATCTGGVCTTTRGWIGAACTRMAKGGSDDCDEELYCDSTGRDPGGEDAGTCKRLARAGERCPTYEACAYGTSCHEDVCVPDTRGGLGEPCGTWGCREGLFCRRSDTTCQRGNVPEGAHCEDMIGIDDCVPGTHCERLGEGTSVPYPQTCQRPVGLGGECTQHACTTDTYCKLVPGTLTYQRTCQARHALLEACESTTECSSGLECRDKRCRPACSSNTAW